VKEKSYIFILIGILYVGALFAHDLKSENKCYQDIWINNLDVIEKNDSRDNDKIYDELIDDKKNGYFYVKK